MIFTQTKFTEIKWNLKKNREQHAPKLRGHGTRKTTDLIGKLSSQKPLELLLTLFCG